MFQGSAYVWKINTNSVIQVATLPQPCAILQRKTEVCIRVGHKNHFPSMISVPAVFGCQMVPAFQKYQIFCRTTSFRWCDIYFSPKNPKGGPFGKKIFFVMKPNNMGIKSCVLMQLNTSWRDKIKISSVFSARAQKVSKMSKIPHFTYFWHLFGHHAKHRWYFDFFSSGYF